jgi:hypothetical protein
MDKDRKKEPGERFNAIISADKEEVETPSELQQPAKSQSPKPPPSSLLNQLPRGKPSAQEPPQVDKKTATPEPETPASSGFQDGLFNSKQPARQTEIVVANQQNIPRREKFLRALWTLTSVISMIVNIVVIIVVVVAFWAYRDIKLPEGLDISLANKLLSGLYTNFEKLDHATIDTSIAVDAPIPLDLNVPVQKTTQITLAEAVNIPNAQVVINTGGLNINSTARVTLPAGTPLMVNLDFDLPVQDTIDVHLDVPVKIPMADTELHEPFVGLQEVVKPLYCLVEPAATSSITGNPVCK